MLRSLAVLLVAGVIGVDGAGQASKIATVTVQPDTMVLSPGDTGRATCVPRNRFGTALATVCSWRVVDTSKARTTTRTQAANIRALKLGKTLVTATAGGKADTLGLTIVSATGTVPPPPDTTYSWFVLPKDQNPGFTAADWRAKGVYFIDTMPPYTLYGKDTLPLPFTCPAGGAQCPQKPGPEFCTFVQFADGKIAERAKDRSRMCDSIYATFSTEHLGPAGWQQTKADSLCIIWQFEPNGTITNHSGRVPPPPDEKCGVPA